MPSYEYSGDGTCRSCKEAILWFRTPVGKSLPVNDGGEGLPMLTRGDTFTVEQAKKFILPNTHFATCPEADRFRSGKRGK